MHSHFDSEHLASEMAKADLGDPRRARRLGQIVAAATLKPDASFPMMVQSEGELEAVYRFLNNTKVTPEAILEPHVNASVQRALDAGGETLLVEDTTYFVFSGDREGMGRLHVKDQGFWAHVALAVGPERECYGIVGLRHGTRFGPSRWKGNRQISDEGNDEHRRWIDLALETGARFGEKKPIHVMDREADWFALMKCLVEHEQRFVIRLCHDRVVEGGGRISSLWEMPIEVSIEREVQLSARAEGHTAKSGKKKSSLGPRSARKATLELRGTRASIRSSTESGVLDLYVVNVRELDAPEGCAPVIWNLLTTEPIESTEDLQKIVDIYRARWTIEEYFKALKTGCAFQKRQLCSYNALVNTLAVLMPVAWTLLRLREAARMESPPPVGGLISPSLLAILRLLCAKRRPLPPNPTAKDVTYSIAALGGHLKRNGDPGWQTLGRGFERLLEAAGALAAAGFEM